MIHVVRWILNKYLYGHLSPSFLEAQLCCTFGVFPQAKQQPTLNEDENDDIHRETWNANDMEEARVISM